MKLKNLVPVLSLALLGAVIYHPVAGFEFTNWDDGHYVTANPYIQSFSLANVRHLFTSFIMGNYAPVQMLTYALDYKIWWLDPKGFHLTNLILHLLNGAGVYFLIRAVTGRERLSWITAALFVVHPANVETVSWIAQRKTLVAQLFFIGSFVLYIRQSRTRDRRAYLLSVAGFAVSLLSKVSTITLPALLLLYDHCYGRGIRRKEIVEKAPFFALSALFSGVAVWAQSGFYQGRFRYHGGDMVSNLLTFLVAFRRYLMELAAPLHLSPYYYFSYRSLASPAVLSSLLVACALLAVIWMFRTDKSLVFGSGWFIIALAPNFQIVPLDAVMADRYLYLPEIGIFLLASRFFVDLEEWVQGRKWTKVAARGAGIVVLACFSFLSWRQTHIWEDDRSLWTAAVQTEPSPLAYNNLAAYFAGQEQWEEAERVELIGLAIDPNFPMGVVNMGKIYAKKKDFPQAELYLKRALSINPGDEDAGITLASVYVDQKKIPQAKQMLRDILQRNPISVVARQKLAAIEWGRY